MTSLSSDYVLGIDIGTGSCKVLAVDFQGNTIAQADAFYPINTPSPNFAEQDPERLWDAFATCVHRILHTVGMSPKAISFSCAMHSLLLIDAQNKPLTPVIIWSDRRSEDVAHALRKSKDGERIYTHTGTPVYSMSPLCKIMWFRQMQPEVFKKAARFVSFKEFLWFRLFGEWQVDYSIASATGLMDIRMYEWYVPALELAGIQIHQLSRLMPTNYMRAGPVSAPDGFPSLGADTQFCIGGNDGCLANVGSFAVQEGIGALTIGTSGALRIAGKSPVYDFDSMLFNYILNTGTYIAGGPINNGGVVIKWLLHTFFNTEKPQNEDYHRLFDMVSQTEAGCDGLIFLPHLLGERTPVWDEQAHALFFGIKASHRLPHFVRAGVEGVCFAIKSILEIMETKGAQIDEIHVSGGFTKSIAWVQMMADITGKKLVLMDSSDASALGAAYICLQTLHPETADVIKPTPLSTFTPEPTVQTAYRKNFHVFQKLYPALRHLYQE